ncbi:MAG: NADH-quinone oxidoreductase subunit N [Bacteroidia bacterium]|nr:NADH-quinone oxidoreductase subunit N [Bacteroidia bacterium]
MNTLLYTSCLGLICMVAEILNLRKILVPVIVVGLAAIFFINIQDWGTNPIASIGGIHLDHMVRIDNFSIAFSSLAIGISILLFILSANYYANDQDHISDYLSILIFILCGAIIMFSFYNLAMLFLGIEILSISLYIMAGSRKFDPRSNEAGFKYFIMGSFSTGILLLGIALIYGSSHSFEIGEIAKYTLSTQPSAMYYTGMLLILVALLFKASAVPFHFWSPDVYEGSPVLITTLMSTLVKVAAFGALYRLLSLGFFGTLSYSEPILILVTAATMFVSNVIALNQNNVKRLLAYSGISHAGYMLLAIVSVGGKTDSSLFFYATVYSLAMIGLFALVIMIFKSNHSENVEAFNGLAKKQPIAAAFIAIFLMSLTGIPPFAGFLGKYYIFSDAFKNGYFSITLFAIFNSIIAIYYYFKIIMAMYGNPANDKQINIHPSYWVVASICLLGVIGLGIVPDMLMQLLK